MNIVSLLIGAGLMISLGIALKIDSHVSGGIILMWIAISKIKESK